MNARTICAFIGVFLFCCSNIYFLEVLVRQDPGIGNLVTFVQFLLFSLHGLFFTYKFGRVKRQIPIRKYGTLVFLFFISSFLNNYAFNFNVPMPLHMIFRSGSLMANMVLGVFILEKKYPISKYISVIMITIGIIICTFQTGSQIKHGSVKNVTAASDDESSSNNVTESIAISPIASKQSEDLFWLSVGVAILTVALFLSARMGIFQETLYVKYGKHPSEALFYTHVLPLPIFLAIAPNLYNHWLISGQSEPFIESIPIPSVRIYLLVNAITQCLCIASVYVLTSECTSLAVTLTVTLRKFASLIFSILYFKNPFTPAHWFGTLLIFVGTCVFTELLQKSLNALAPKKVYEKLVQDETELEETTKTETSNTSVGT